MARSPREISRRSEDGRDNARFCSCKFLLLLLFVLLPNHLVQIKRGGTKTAILDDGILSSYGNFNEKTLTFSPD